MFGMKMAAFWIVVPCGLVEVYGRFKGTFCVPLPVTYHFPNFGISPQFEQVIYS
jgi:hypothetical protein